MIQAIETNYAGYRFRSRLEARWAVFFDSLGIPWEYEPQGFMLGRDFPDEGITPKPYLPDFWLSRSKTWVEVKGDANQFDWQLLADAVEYGEGLPETEGSDTSTRGLLLLGAIPPRQPRAQPLHPILQHYKGGYVNLVTFTVGTPHLHYCPGHVFTSRDTFFESHWPPGRDDDWATWIRELWQQPLSLKVPCDALVLSAYDAARQARFEHGETPRRRWR